MRVWCPGAARLPYCCTYPLVGAYGRSAMSTNKAAILKAVGAENEAQATKLLAELDMGLGESSSFLSPFGGYYVWFILLLSRHADFFFM